MAELADSHCHLDFGSFDSDREAVLDRADRAGITRILDPGIDLQSSREAVGLADVIPKVYAAVGVHPNEAAAWNENSLVELRDLASHPKVVAIGEIGLDYYRERAPYDVQRRVLLQQLDLAAELELPVVIHNRQAASDLIAILVEWRHTLIESYSPLAVHPGVLHSFSENAGIADQAIRIGFYIGITGPVTFRNASALQQTVSMLPLDHLLIETDSPFLTPHPHRGGRNEPAYVRLVAEKIADLHQVTFEAVADATTANAGSLFKWRENS